MTSLEIVERIGLLADRRRIDIKTKYINTGSCVLADLDCDCGSIHLLECTKFQRRTLVACPCKPPRYINMDGTYVYDLSRNS